MGSVKCSKCGSEISTDSRFCNKCGNRVEEEKKKPVIAIVMNISAFIYVICSILFLYVNEGIALELLLKYMSVCIIGCIIGGVSFVIKASKMKKIVSSVGIVVAVINLCICVFSIFINIGIAFIINLSTFIPSILQLIAGVKFLKILK